MTFNVSADAYDRFMGRFSEPLAARFVELAQVEAGRRALDVGCGPGALTAQLVDRLGADAVSAVDPSGPFVAAVRTRFPGVDARSGVAEHLPFPDDGFDLALTQLVVHFMADPVAGSLPACGTTPEAAVPSPRSGGPRATSIPRYATSRDWRAPGKVTWRSCARRPA